MAHQRAPEQHASRDPALLTLGAAIVGGALLGGRSRERRRRAAGVAAGLALVALAVRPYVANAVRAAGTKRRTGELRFSLLVERPVEQVFAFFGDFENFPRFIGSLREVNDSGDGRVRWVGRTPSGGSIEWHTRTSKYVTNSVIGWKSVPGALVDMTGLLRFTPENGHTCVHVAIDYCVRDGHLRDAIVSLFPRRRRASLEAEFRSFSSLLADHAAEKVAEQLPAVATPGAEPVVSPAE